MQSNTVVAPASSVMLCLIALLVLPCLGKGVLAEEPRFVVVAHGKPPVPWWTVLKNGVDGAAKELDVAVEYRAPDEFDMTAMSALIDAAVASKPDGIAVTIPDKNGLSNALRKAVASGIPVVSLNSGSEAYADLGIALHVGQPEYEAGLAAGQRMREEGATRVVCLNQEGGNIAGRQRCRGFADGFGGDVDELALSYEVGEVRAAADVYFEAHPAIDGALILGPTAAAPVIEVLAEKGLLGQISLGTFDYTPAVLDAIDRGQVAFAVDQQPYLQGYLPVFFLKKYDEFGVLPTGVIKTGPSFISSKNVQQVIELSAEGIR